MVPALILALLFGKAAEKLSKVVSRKFKKANQEIQLRLEKLVKQSNKKICAERRRKN